MSEIKIVANDKDYTSRVSKAVKFFWNTKKRQLKDSGDESNRGAVVGGKQMDGFIDLLKKVTSMPVCLPKTSSQIRTIYLAIFAHPKTGIC